MTNVILFNNHAQTTFVRLAQKQDTFINPFKDLPSPSKDLPKDFHNVLKHRFSFQQRYDQREFV
jgi:hypothetical protein